MALWAPAPPPGTGAETFYFQFRIVGKRERPTKERRSAVAVIGNAGWSRVSHAKENPYRTGSSFQTTPHAWWARCGRFLFSPLSRARAVRSLASIGKRTAVAHAGDETGRERDEEEQVMVQAGRRLWLSFFSYSSLFPLFPRPFSVRNIGRRAGATGSEMRAPSGAQCCRNSAEWGIKGIFRASASAAVAGKGECETAGRDHGGEARRARSGDSGTAARRRLQVTRH
ncbi:hypothetical protein MRX96_010518 [Rhipicephalus microplus]